jgi:hypothetical protein
VAGDRKMPTLPAACLVLSFVLLLPFCDEPRVVADAAARRGKPIRNASTSTTRRSSSTVAIDLTTGVVKGYDARIEFLVPPTSVSRRPRANNKKQPIRHADSTGTAEQSKQTGEFSCTPSVTYYWTGILIL